MLSAIETMPKPAAVANRASLTPLDRLPADQGPPIVASGVILNLGQGLPTRLTYDQTGAFGGSDSALRVAPSRAPAASTTSPAAALTTLSSARIVELINAAANVENAMATTAREAIPVATSATPPTPVPAEITTSNAGTVAVTVSPSGAIGTAPVTPPITASEVLAVTQNAGAISTVIPSVDPVSQALSNITENPAYAGMAASLYLSVAAYRSPQSPVVPMPDRTEMPKTVNAILAARQVDAESRENQNGQSNTRGRARALRG